MGVRISLARTRVGCGAYGGGFTPKVRGQIEQAIAAGSSYSAAAQYAGIGKSTLHSWLARGRAERDVRKHEPTERRFVLLADAVERASARAEVAPR